VTDHVDRVLEQWAEQRPDLDVSPMAIIGRLSRLSRLISAELTRTFSAHELDSASFDVLATLRRNGRSLTPAELMKSAMVTSGAITQRLDRLQSRGLVSRTPSEKDGRVVHVALTEEGRELIDRALPDHVETERRLLDWFAEGAAKLEAAFATTDPGVPVWTWSGEQSVGFWLRMQTIEAAIHRWDAEMVTGTAGTMDAELAADAVGQTFEVMAPARRAWTAAPPGTGETYGFRQSDGPGRWTVRFDGPDVSLAEGTNVSLGDGADVSLVESGGCDVEVAGTASDLMLFLWHRIPYERLDVHGDRAVLDRYFTLVPPV
jgi:uncharacterized protein (TIGR03083 family)